MSELRQDVVTGQWVVLAAGRASRPADFIRCERGGENAEERECPFCPGNELMTPPELMAVRPGGSQPDTPGWRVRVVPNKFPAFGEGEYVVSPAELFPSRAASGSHEVIIHGPGHHRGLEDMTSEDIEALLRVYRHRYRANARMPDVRYVHVMVNYGRSSGASLNHPHSQLFGMPLVPQLLQQELAGASWYKKSRGRCVFCSLISEELDLMQRVVLKNRGFVALAPFASRFPFEVWLIPRRHQESYEMLDDEQFEDLAALLKEVLLRYRERLDGPSYNLYIHTAPCDGDGYPYYHWHLELSPRTTRPGAFELGTSTWINVVSPENAAEELGRGR